MTVAAAVTETVYALAGTNLGPFSTVWPFEAAGDVLVKLDTGAGFVAVDPSQYTLTAPSPLSAGGSVTLASSALTAVAAAWPTGARLALTRGVANDQEGAFGEALGFSPQALEDALDHVERQLQDIRSGLSRSLKSALGTTTAALDLARWNGQLLGVAGGQVIPYNLYDIAVNQAGLPVLQNVPALPNLAALRALTSVASGSVFVQGWLTPGDGGGGMFVYVGADTTSADDHGTVLVPAAPLTGRWHRLIPPWGVTLEMFGGGVAVADNSQALAWAFAALAAKGGRIALGAGQYSFAAQAVLTYDAAKKPFALALVGAGPDATTLYWAGGGGLELALTDQSHSFTLQDFTLATGATATGNGLTLTTTVAEGAFGQNTLQRIKAQGLENTGVHFWAIGVDVIAVPNITFDACLFYGGTTAGPTPSGVGVQLTGNGALSPPYAIVYNFVNCNWVGHADSLLYGAYVQGVQVANCNITNSQNGIRSPAGAAGILAQLAVTNSQFACTKNNIKTETYIDNIILTGNLFYASPNNNSVNLVQCGGGSVIGNQFTCNGTLATGQLGLIVGTTEGNAPLVAVGNYFLFQAVGVTCQAGSKSVNAQSNIYLGCTSNHTDAGTGNVFGGGSA